MTNTRARELIDSGYRMPAPDGTPDEVYQLMLRLVFFSSSHVMKKQCCCYRKHHVKGKKWIDRKTKIIPSFSSILLFIIVLRVAERDVKLLYNAEVPASHYPVGWSDADELPARRWGSYNALNLYFYFVLHMRFM